MTITVIMNFLMNLMTILEFLLNNQSPDQW